MGRFDRFVLPNLNNLGTCGAWVAILFLSVSPAGVLAQLAAGTTSGVTSEDSIPIPDGSWQAEVARLQQQIDALKLWEFEGAQAPLAGNGSNAEANAPVICTPPNVSQEPTYPSVKLTGFFQADALWIQQSPENRVAVGQGIAADGDVQDGADFRRARLAATGSVWDNVTYMLEMDFAFPGRPSFMDVWLDIEGAGGHFRLGQFRQPIGMDGLTSVKELTFLERGLPFAFLPFRQIGMMAYGTCADELATWAISGFRYPTDAFGGNVGDNGGYGIATRVTSVLVDRGQGGLLHVGGGYSFIDPSNDFVQYRNQPEVFAGETGGAALVPSGVPSNLPPFVNTGLIAANNVNLVNLETAMSFGSLYLQSEAIASQVAQTSGSSLLFSGVYVHAGYFLTGETRTYNRRSGVFGRVKPKKNIGRQGGIGAWEIAGRWSHIDLHDKNIQGNQLENATFGLNWYLNPNTKLQFNYIHAMLVSPINGSSAANLFAMRAQLDF